MLVKANKECNKGNASVCPWTRISDYLFVTFSWNLVQELLTKCCQT